MQDNDVKWEGTANEFKGKIAHHGAGRPFKDGFQAGGQKYVDAKAEGEAQPEAQQAEAVSPSRDDLRCLVRWTAIRSSLALQGSLTAW